MSPARPGARQQASPDPCSGRKPQKPIIRAVSDEGAEVGIVGVRGTD